MKKCIGIDPSHETFSAAFPLIGQEYRTEDFSQDSVGFTTFLSQIPVGSKVIVEDTGSFSARLLLFLYQKGISVHLVSSHQINGFRKMVGSRAKNDAQDAIAIARYGEMVAPPLWRPREDFVVELRQLTATEALLIKQKTMLKNQRFAFRLEPQSFETVEKLIQQSLDTIQSQIKTIEKAIRDLIHRYFSHQATLLRSVPGLGARTVPALLVVVQDFARFPSARQLAAFLGLTPTTFRSGKSVRRKPKISKVGPAYLRKLLYMGAASAVRHNPFFRTFYLKLVRNGKNKQAALIAVAHKIVRVAFGVVKNNQPFDPNFLAKN